VSQRPRFGETAHIHAKLPLAISRLGGYAAEHRVVGRRWVGSISAATGDDRQ
jgi:hypothetical protein